MSLDIARRMRQVISSGDPFTSVRAWEIAAFNKAGLLQKFLSRVATHEAEEGPMPSLEIDSLLALSGAARLRPEWLLCGTGAMRRPSSSGKALDPYPNRAEARELAVAADLPTLAFGEVDAYRSPDMPAKTVWWWLAEYIRMAGSPDLTPPARLPTGPRPETETFIEPAARARHRSSTTRRAAS